MDDALIEEYSACLPAASLVGLAPLRVHTGIRARLLGDRVWLWWAAGEDAVFQRVLALHGVELFERRDGCWHRPGQHLPAFVVPSDEGARTLLHILTPAPVQADGGSPSFLPLNLRLVREDRPRAAAALCCSLSDLGSWADRATSRQLRELGAVYSGHDVLIRGERLPPLPVAARYWGRSVLIPLGFRTEPEATEGVLREALNLQPEEIALLANRGFEVIDARLFQPLTRAGVRLALREGR